MTTSLMKLKKMIKKNKLDAVLISSHSNITYLTNYSGFSKEEREAYLFIVTQPQRLTHKTPEVLGYILTDGRYAQAVKTLIPDFKLIEISPKLSFGKAIEKLVGKHKIKKLGFEGHDITFSEHKKLSSRFNDLPRRPLRRIEASKAGLNHFSLNSLRAIKNKEEISKIEKACQLGDKTFDYILKKIKLGVSEKEVANEIEFFIKSKSADISFAPIVAFDKNSAIPHHVPSDTKLEIDNIVLLDFGIKLNNYCSDMTRTVFFGKAISEQKKMYETVLEAQAKAIDFLNKVAPSRRCNLAKDVDKVARDYIISQGYPAIPHSLGHGVGIQIHESPRLSPKSKDILKEGMVFSIEPGIYIPEFGGVRIEDLVVLEKNKVRLLTHAPKSLIEV